MAWGGSAGRSPPFVGHSRKSEKATKKRGTRNVKIPIKTGGPLTVHRANTYRAELKRVEDAGVNPFDSAKEQLKLHWHLIDVPDAEEGPAMFSHWVNKSAHEKSTLMAIASTLWDTDIDDLVANADDIDTDDLAGGRCRLVLTVERNDKGQDVNKVKAYLPIEDAPAPAPALAPTQPATVRRSFSPPARTAVGADVPF